MDVVEEEMLRQLNLFKLKNGWVQCLDVKKGRKISKDFLQKNIVIVEKGILHSEVKINEKYQFFIVIQSDDIIYPPAMKSESNSWRVVADTSAKVILINKEYFLNYATVEPKYMEWLLTKMNEVFHKTSFEVTKFTQEWGVKTTIEHIYEVMEKEGMDKNQLSRCFSKQNLISYAQVSRYIFDNEWDKLREIGFV
ncbi:hypothetical protein HCJ52_12880 [Listeria sp. FSL L7-1485]|uniref:Crp/Fnr family transcriptional regulator n=1 Tax=Listeria immobilis TaxID=2713502 RepID=A0A7X1CA73_9LIST|nr:hypothetical protein [Listeria immobilis]MBC1483163.1 hypothetical protein [Listeria immobilis]MBC1489992.1 hypothetical protein [Listeria immobilis]MBC1505983.1 hypothetical protein [Listeria immobilis]MBC1508627.1 hypothetical protein [Listeria immobilis]MBC1516663.1 hypothetical protein [Listeria immobilis]